jgi:hypothetical protein
MASLRPHSRYSSYDARSSASSSHFSDLSSSTEFQSPAPAAYSSSTSRALVKSKPSDLARTKSKPSKNPGLSTMVKKFMEKKSSEKPKAVNRATLVIPSDALAENLKKTARKGTSFSGLQKKLFGKGTTAFEEEDKKKEVKALTEVKGNARTLAMVLRSERELLVLNKEQEMEIAELKRLLEEKNTEVSLLGLSFFLFNGKGKLATWVLKFLSDYILRIDDFGLILFCCFLNEKMKAKVCFLLTEREYISIKDLKFYIGSSVSIGRMGWKRENLQVGL